MPAMLEGLDDVPWESLHHAHGVATSVPAWIRALLSTSPEDRHEALMTLFQTIWHQGTVYDATARAVPFLIELLRDDRTPDRDQLANLVASIAAGSGYLERQLHVDFVREAADEQAKAEGTTLAAKQERERAWVDATRRAAEPSLPLLLPFLDHEEADLRANVARALGHYPARAEELLPPLRAAMERERGGDARQAMQRAILLLTGKKVEVDAEDDAPRDAAEGALRARTRKRRWADLIGAFPVLIACGLFITGHYVAAAVVFILALVCIWLVERRRSVG